MVSGEASARSVVESAVNAAENLNETLNAFLQIDRAGALQRAEDLNKMFDPSTTSQSTDNSLAAVPIAFIGPRPRS